MADLPLESSIKKAQSHQKERLSSLLSSAMMCGVLVHDGLFIRDYIILLITLFCVLMMVKGTYYRTVAAFALSAFVAGAFATTVERFWHERTLVTAQEDSFVSATITAFERQKNDRARLWLSDVSVLDDKTALVRATIDQMPDVTLGVGDSFKGRVRLYPLSGPLFPGWPDYARKSWREGIVAIAYGRAPQITSSDQLADRSVISAMRHEIRRHVAADLSPANATLAKALFIGERDFSDDEFYAPFRKAGLAHLLAISGLHMGLFCFGVYGVFRVLLALPVRLSSYVAHHKIAALLALGSGLFYLFLAGTPISAIRAYLMTSFILCALLWGRRMVTLRNVNYVMMLFLLCYPSALYQPAFQLSFAATYGIVMFHDSQSRKRRNVDFKWLRRLYYLVATSTIAIASTFFITAYHFGTISLWGVVSNIIAIPYTGLVVMPVGVAYVLSLGIGAGDIMAPLLALVLSTLILIATMVSQLPYSDIRLITPLAIYLPLFGLLGLWGYLSEGRARFTLIMSALIAIGLWSGKVVPIGGISGNERFVRFALLDNGRLYHSHRLSDFWADSYLKLLGRHDKTVKLSCRKNCHIERGNGDVIAFATKTPLAHCPSGKGVIIARAEVTCPSYQTLILKEGDFSYKLFYNNHLGYYLHQEKQHKPPRPWRVSYP